MLHFRRMRRGDVGAVVRILVPDASEALRALVRGRLRLTRHPGATTLVVVAIDSKRANSPIVGVAVLHCILVLSDDRDRMVGMLNIRAADLLQESEAMQVFEWLFDEMRNRVLKEPWACEIEELGGTLTFV